MRIDREGTNIRRQPLGGEERVTEHRPGEQRPAPERNGELREGRGGKEVFGRDRFVPSLSEEGPPRPGLRPQARSGHQGGGLPMGPVPMPHARGGVGGSGHPGHPPDAAADASERFAQADLDGDGMLSQEEFAAALSVPPQRPQGVQPPPMGFPGRRPEGPPPGGTPPESELLAYFSGVSPASVAEVPEEADVTQAEGDAAFLSEGAAIQDMVLSQLEAMLQETELADEERMMIMEMGNAIALLDPAASDFTAQLEAILGGVTEA